MVRSRSRSNAEVAVPMDSDTTTSPILIPSHHKSSRTREELEEVDLGVFAFDKSEPSSRHPSPRNTTTQLGSQGGDSNLAGMRALEQLRKRLDAIDEHSRELRSARHILIKREQTLIDERDELVDTLNSIEHAMLASSPPTTVYRMPQVSNTHNVDDDRTGQPSKRKAIVDPMTDRPTTRQRSSESLRQVAGGQRTSPGGLPSLRPLATEPTLIQECPSEVMYPSSTLPRPLETTPPSSFAKTPAPSPRSGSITRNGIRFPPGSAPARAPRSRSSSPLTQMLPPPVPASPVTPVPTKVYNPIIRCILEAESPTDAVKNPDSVERVLPLLPALSSMRTPENDEVYTNPPRTPKAHNGTIPIYLILNDRDSTPKWDISQISPERTPSPPIGASHPTWDIRPRPDSTRRYVEEEGSVLELRAAIKSMDGKLSDLQDGPASRTRARVSSAGIVQNKGKGRV